jgi:hypothetical protein
MKITTINFPSIFETVFGNTENSATDLLHGIKIKRNESWYQVGEPCQEICNKCRPNCQCSTR